MKSRMNSLGPPLIAMPAAGLAEAHRRPERMLAASLSLVLERQSQFVLVKVGLGHSRRSRLHPQTVRSTQLADKVGGAAN